MKLEGGFLKPMVENDDCIECNKCLSVCAFQHKEVAGKEDEIHTFAAYSNDEDVRRLCSSGGVGLEFAKQAIREGYYFCGVRYNVEQGRAEHYIARSQEELDQSIGSKYIQSYTLTAFSEFEKGKKYVVVGTPCQIDSLRHYIKNKKIEDNFILIDFFCHGVPSMLMWQKYMDEKKQQVGSSVKYVSWRSKKNGWQDSWAMEIHGEKNVFSLKSQGDLFYKFFLKNRCLGKPCYENCKYKMLSSAADIRIGDLWGTKYQYNKEGISAVVSFTKKGKKLIEAVDGKCTFIPENIEVTTESQMKVPAKKPASYSYVYKKLRTDKTLSEIDKVASRKEKLFDELPWALQYYPKRVVEIVLCKLGL